MNYHENNKNVNELHTVENFTLIYSYDRIIIEYFVYAFKADFRQLW